MSIHRSKKQQPNPTLQPHPRNLGSLLVCAGLILIASSKNTWSHPDGDGDGPIQEDLCDNALRRVPILPPAFFSDTTDADVSENPSSHPGRDSSRASASLLLHNSESSAPRRLTTPPPLPRSNAPRTLFPRSPTGRSTSLPADSTIPPPLFTHDQIQAQSTFRAEFATLTPGHRRYTREHSVQVLELDQRARQTSSVRSGVRFVSLINGQQKLLNKILNDHELVDALNNFYLHEFYELLEADPSLRNHLVTLNTSEDSLGGLPLFNGLALAFENIDQSSLTSLDQALRRIHAEAALRLHQRVVQLGLQEAYFSAHPHAGLLRNPRLWWNLGSFAETIDDATLSGRQARRAMAAALPRKHEHLSPTDLTARENRAAEAAIASAWNSSIQNQIRQSLEVGRRAYVSLKTSTQGSSRRLFNIQGRLKDEVLAAFRASSGDPAQIMAKLNRIMGPGLNMSLHEAETLSAALSSLDELSASPLQSERRSLSFVQHQTSKQFVYIDLQKVGVLNLKALEEEFYHYDQSSDSLGIRSRRAFDEASRIIKARALRIITTLQGSSEATLRNTSVLETWPWQEPLTLQDQEGNAVALFDMSGDDMLIGFQHSWSEASQQIFLERLSISTNSINDPSEMTSFHPSNYRITIIDPHDASNIPLERISGIRGELENLEKKLRTRLEELSGESSSRSPSLTLDLLRSLGFSFEAHYTNQDENNLNLWSVHFRVLGESSLTEPQRNLLMNQINSIMTQFARRPSHTQGTRYILSFHPRSSGNPTF